MHFGTVAERPGTCEMMKVMVPLLSHIYMSTCLHVYIVQVFFTGVLHVYS